MGQSFSSIVAPLVQVMNDITTAYQLMSPEIQAQSSPAEANLDIFRKHGPCSIKKSGTSNTKQGRRLGSTPRLGDMGRATRGRQHQKRHVVRTSPKTSGGRQASGMTPSLFSMAARKCSVDTTGLRPRFHVKTIGKAWRARKRSPEAHTYERGVKRCI